MVSISSPIYPKQPGALFFHCSCALKDRNGWFELVPYPASHCMPRELRFPGPTKVIEAPARSPSLLFALRRRILYGKLQHFTLRLASWDWLFIQVYPIIYSVFTSQVVQDFFHQQFQRWPPLSTSLITHSTAHLFFFKYSVCCASVFVALCIWRNDLNKKHAYLEDHPS